MAATKKKPARKPRPKKPAQDKLPGMGNVYIDELDAAAREVKLFEQSRMAEAKEEQKARAKLLDLMHEHKQEVYESVDGYTVKIVGKEKVSVRSKAVEVESNGESEE